MAPASSSITMVTLVTRLLMAVMVVMAVRGDEYNIGVGIADVTGPAAEVGMVSYVLV